MDDAKPDSAAAAIEVRVEEIGELFDNLDPLPFRERDLDAHAEEFIVGWARELPRDRPIRIVVHVPEAEARTARAGQLPDALRRYFGYRADTLARELTELFRIGRLSLAIGISVLALCIVLGQIISGLVGPGYLGRFVEESSIILGWVANWKPIEIFLYDWWPVVRRRNLYRRLAQAQVAVSASSGAV